MSFSTTVPDYEFDTEISTIYADCGQPVYMLIRHNLAIPSAILNALESGWPMAKENYSRSTMVIACRLLLRL